MKIKCVAVNKKRRGSGSRSGLSCKRNAVYGYIYCISHLYPVDTSGGAQ